jgi:hypothetical protein
LTGVQITHVPYRGTAQSVVDLLEGRMELLVGAINSTQEFVRSGRLTAFAVLSKQRVAVLPDVPTAAEAGVPGCEAELWSAIVMQAGVPRPIVEKLNQAVNDVVSMSQIQDSLHQQGVAVESGNQTDVKPHWDRHCQVARRDRIRQHRQALKARNTDGRAGRMCGPGEQHPGRSPAVVPPSAKALVDRYLCAVPALL